MNSKTPEISIITRPSKIFFSGCLRYYAKLALRRILGKHRGPDVVLQSLIRGLSGAGSISFNINPPLRRLASVVHVISNPEALRWAIEEKKAGRIRKVVAGPNISILPIDDEGILSDPDIDAILLPSEWVRDLYIKSAPSIEKKLRIWPAGVEMPEKPAEKNGNSIIIFRKNAPEGIFDTVKRELEARAIPYEIIVYGSYDQASYFSALKRCRGLIYLQTSESQGIALQEAWARNVPALVWNCGTFERDGFKIEGKVAAPYLSEESGMFFSGSEDFPAKLDEFMSRLGTFSPFDYCEKHLSDEASAAIYLEAVLK